MDTTVVKFSNLKENLYAAVQVISKKLKNVNSTITMTIKSSKNVDLQVKEDDEEENIEKLEIQDISNIFKALDEEEESDSDIDIRISTKDILPNIYINEVESDSQNASFEKNKNVLEVKNPTEKGKSSILKYSERELTDRKDVNENQISSDFNECIPDEFERQNQKMSKMGTQKKIKLSSKKSLKRSKIHEKFHRLEKKQLSEESDHFQSISDDESYPQSCAIIESKLNEAWIYIKRNKIFELEEFLYTFKTKYMYFSEKVQIKWRILMAYCKQNRKQYERASILYKQVTEIVQQSPNLLSIDLADIYHRLGICYSEIRSWNDGILAFTKALNGFKEKKKRVKYAECANNIGTLYLNAYAISSAQKFFLLSYTIKKKQYHQNSKRLLSSLFNLYECNIIRRNYDQARQILKQLQKIINSLSDNKMLQGGIARRKGKLNFLKGNLDLAEELYEDAFMKLSKDYPYSLEFGELLNNLGLLKLDTQYFSASKQFFQKSLVILNFYYTKDSTAIQTLKRNLELLEELLKKKKKYEKKASSLKEQLYYF